MTAICALILAVDTASVISVHALMVQGRPAVEIVTSAAPSGVAVERVGAELVVSMEASLPRPLVTSPVPPLGHVLVSAAHDRTSVRIGVEANVPYEVRRQAKLLTVLFGGNTSVPASTAPTAAADVQELYARLRPAPIAGTADGAQLTDESGASVHANDGDRPVSEGLQVGLLTLRPGLSAIWADAEGALLETAEPVKDRYYEIRPRVSGDLPLGTGQLRADYEARLRRGSTYALVEDTTTHLGDASLELPIGPNVLARVGGHFARGVLETSEVDPGREYFFQLGRYTRHDLSAGLRVQTGGRLDLDAGVARQVIDVDEQVGFFGYERRSASGGLGVELGPRLRGLVAYGYEEIPATDERVEAEMTAHSGSLLLLGEILPLVTGHLQVGYRDQKNPRVSGAGGRYRGLAASVRLVKEFSRASALTLNASRQTPPSGFENNGFYVSTAVDGELAVPLPAEFAFHSGAGHRWNNYRLPASAIGAPREDRILGWSVGLGRPITAWGSVRADYRYEQRESNIDLFDTDAHAFTVQLGVRFYRPAERMIATEAR